MAPSIGVVPPWRKVCRTQLLTFTVHECAASAQLIFNECIDHNAQKMLATSECRRLFKINKKPMPLVERAYGPDLLTAHELLNPSMVQMTRKNGRNSTASFQHARIFNYIQLLVSELNLSAHA